MADAPAPIHVCAAIVRRNLHVLLAQRPAGKHLAGFWEFPGGKVHPDEDLFGCIRREMAEELGLQATPIRHLLTVEHAYPEKSIRLHCIECTIPPDAIPIHHEGQASKWTAIHELADVTLAPADRTVAQWLQQHHPLQPPCAHA